MQLGAEPTRVINIGLNQQCPAGYTASDYPTYRSCRYSGFPPVAPTPSAGPAVITVSPTIQTQVSPQVSPVFQQAFQPQQSPLTAGTTQTIPTTQQAASPKVVSTSPPVAAQPTGPSTDAIRLYELQLQAQAAEAAEQRKLVQDILTKMTAPSAVTTSAPVQIPVPYPSPVSAPAPAADSGSVVIPGIPAPVADSGSVVIPGIPAIEKSVAGGKNTQIAMVAGIALIGMLIFMKGNKNATRR